MNKKKLLLLLIAAGIVVIAAASLYAWEMHRSTQAPQNDSACATELEKGDFIAQITAISGNDITLRNSHAGETMHLQISSTTNYYDVDTLTPIASSSLLLIGQYVSAYGEYCVQNSFIDASHGYLWRAATLADIPAPAGWYAHRMGVTQIIFTKQAQLPVATDTETLAYGEQIQVYVAPLTNSPEDWASLMIGNPDGTTGAPAANEWGMLNGHRTLQAEQITEADKGFFYVIFGSKTAYVFFLYPYPNPADLPVLQKMVGDFSKNIP